MPDETIRHRAEQLLARITPGQWVADDFCEEADERLRVGTTDGGPHYYQRSTTIAICAWTTREERVSDPDSPVIGIVQAEANAEWIAASPQLVRDLLSTLALIEQERDAFKKVALINKFEAEKHFKRAEAAESRLQELRQDRDAQFAHNSSLMERIKELEEDNDFQMRYLVAVQKELGDPQPPDGHLVWNLVERVRQIRLESTPPVVGSEDTREEKEQIR